MPEFNEVKISRILNPTSIGLGDFVINPFMGCEFGCLYCYVRGNRVVSRKNKPWGEYVDIRVNAPELLENEIIKNKPKQVLLGSTTECFQPIERKYKITEKILDILNKHKVNFVILTRSPFILDYLPLLKAGFCRKVYFTLNNFGQKFKAVLEPKSPDFKLREQAINTLIGEGISVVPYFSPVLPFVSSLKDIFNKFEGAESIELECLNFNLPNIKEIINKINLVEPSLQQPYERMLSDAEFYINVFKNIEEEIKNAALTAKKRYNIYIHNFGGYFKNKYEK
ncbi:MAG: radical SAM protein [Candidatus Omnitrophica bacterium]|nr:radical SAM protein [Candidatus Omnitrophota bacterium]